MSFELSFSPEFFFAPEEPYDTSEPALNADGQPVSVWSAIEALRQDKDAWDSMCTDCFPGVPSEFVTSESVLELVEKTNTCGTLSSPVDVWIDEHGNHTINVYEQERNTIMDPNETLKAMLEKAKEVIELIEEGDDVYEECPEMALELANYVVALDTWIHNGGFLPDRWENRTLKRSPRKRA